MIAILLLLATAALLVFYINTALLFSHFKAWLPYEDFWKQMLLMARALPPAAGHHEVSGRKGHAESGAAHRARQDGLGHQLWPTQQEGTEGCHTQSQGSQVLTFTSAKSTVTLPGQKKGRNSHSAGQAGARISHLWEWSQRKKKCIWVWVQLFDPLLEMVQLQGQAVPFRPAFLQSWPLIYAADMQTRCCYGAFIYSACVCLLWTPHLLSVLQSLQRDDTKEYVEKAPCMPQCSFLCSVVVEAWKKEFILHFHLLVKVCLCFVPALPFVPPIRICFFGIFFFSENSICVHSYSLKLPYSEIAWTFVRGGSIFNQASQHRYKPHLQVWKEMCLHFQDELRRNALNFIRSIDQLYSYLLR